MLGIKYRTVPLNDSFEIIKKDYMSPNGGIVIANPNAPTGILMDKESIREILEYNNYNLILILFFRNYFFILVLNYFINN